MTRKFALEEVQGDSFGKKLQFTDKEDEVIDIGNWTIYVTVKDTYDDADVDAVLSKDVTAHDDAANGITSFEFAASETEDLSGSYYYEIKYEDGSGTVDTLLRGRLDFVSAVRKSI